ncbi:hypothetical protein [Streptomyces sp. URMC 129]|uniref:hypothetical protein n=1 Tax=Streptomyces sp. URMC 129 TaxID=3423407 RepID=UPI003F1B301D
MDTWLADMGAYFEAFPDAPALAVDMALYGPPADLAGYGLARSMIRTPEQIDLYPSSEMG